MSALPAGSGDEILGLVREQTALGPRVPGTEAHDAVKKLLAGRLGEYADEVRVQEFSAVFQGHTVQCGNVIGEFRARHPPRQKGRQAEGAERGPLLVGTHFDTRPRADRDPDSSLRESPIPGANDGGSGTAVLQHVLPRIRENGLDRDLIIVFFDAEDLGEISGNPFSLGAEYMAAHFPDGLGRPSEVLVLDMIGGREMVLDIDAHAIDHRPSRELTRRVFALGSGRGFKPFTSDKPDRLKYIICDHWPFIRRGIPSCVLIDIDYPEWHTHADLPEAMSEESLGITEEVLSLFLWPSPGKGPRSSPGLLDL